MKMKRRNKNNNIFCALFFLTILSAVAGVAHAAERPPQLGEPSDGQSSRVPSLNKKRIAPPFNRSEIHREADDPKSETVKASTPDGTPRGRSGYWNDVEGHMTFEAGIAANPWTKSGRNFGQYYLDRANTVTLNQIVGSLSHPISNVGGGYGVGFVFEVLYGSDARLDPTLGMADGVLTGLYQIIPTQAHIDFHVPWLVPRGVDIQVGQSYGLLGSEGTPAMQRPFYSFNYASDFIVPFQTVGVTTTLHLSKHFDWVTGIDAGNSTTFGNAGNNSRPKGTAGLAFTHLMDGKLDGHIFGHFGPQGNNSFPVMSPQGRTSSGLGPIANDLMEYNGDIVLDYHVNDKVAVMMDATYLHSDVAKDDLYGVTTYLSWDVTPSTRINLRGEIFRDNTGAFVSEFPGPTEFLKSMRNLPFAYYAAPPTTYGELTAGVTYKPPFINEHLRRGKFVVRPEVRLDKSLNGTQPFNRSATLPDPVVRNGTNNMFWFSCDAVYSF